jgi:hypothetical protein
MGRAQLKGPNGLGPNGIGSGPKWAGPNRHGTSGECIDDNKNILMFILVQYDSDEELQIDYTKHT